MSLLTKAILNGAADVCIKNKINPAQLVDAIHAHFPKDKQARLEAIIDLGALFDELMEDNDAILAGTAVAR